MFGNKFLTFKKTTLFFKSWIQEGITAFKNLKIVNGKLDVNYLNEILIDKRQLHSQVNMLQKSFILAKITASIDPTRDTSIPVYVHHTNEVYTWEQKRAKYYYHHLIQEIVTLPTSELYWRNFTNGRCYVCQNYVFYLFDKVMSCIIPGFFSFEINLVSSAILEVLL